jgi:hypothetical protein
MTERRRKGETAKSGLYAPLPEEIAAVVRRRVLDLNGISLFCGRQVECAALFGRIAEIKPGRFELKPPFRENFIRSLHVYLMPNARFSPPEMVAYTLLRHAKWYLSIRDTDALRARAGRPITPRLLRGSMAWTEGIIRPEGQFTTDPEAGGTPAILAWQDSAGDRQPVPLKAS